MAHSLHFNTMLAMLKAGDPVDISVWKSNGEIIHLHNVIALPYKESARYSGCQNFKILSSGQIRKIRHVCIFRINDCEVFL